MTIWGITFTSWHNIWSLFLFAGVVGILLYSYRKVSGSIGLLASRSGRAQLFKRAGKVRRFARLFLQLIGFLFLFITLLQPQWNEKEELVDQEGRDVLIALDVSRSMLAEDIKPNRLAFAKEKIKQLVRQLDSERVGLILFAGDAFVQCPLTHDKHAFALFLDQVDAHTISSGTTALDKALSKAIDVYANMPQRKNRLVVTFTDGEDFSSNLARIKQRAQKLGMHLFTVGVGTHEGAPVPIIDQAGKKIGYEKQADGTIVMSRLNQGILETLAHDVGGIYVHATPQSDADISSIVNQVGQFEKEAFDQANIVQLEQQYPYFVGVSFICFLLEWLL